MIGQTVSHYKVLDKLGEGGMGVVYKAEDIKLKRTVALKFLPHHLTSTQEEQARFVQEAQAAATLNHPNVCTIYGIEEHEGPAFADASASVGTPAGPDVIGAGKQQFIEMEYVDGVTMRAKTQQAPLKTNDAISYAIQIGEALQEAHTKGIVHRDIKADNIMVNAKNQVKVMDFGLAKLKGSLKLTRSSSTVGTLAYMAPEQIQGGVVDARSDIFSFGVVLYEMLTGRTPFRGEHDAAMMYSILNEEPEPIEKHRPELSSEFFHILNRALEKDPEDRYQTVHDMVIDLRRLRRESSRVSRVPLAEVPIAKPQEAPEPASQPELPRKIQKPRVRRYVIPATIAGVLLLAVLGYVSFFGGEAETGERIPVAVIDFVNETGEQELDGLSGMLITSLEQSRRLAVLTRSRMFDVLKQLGMEDVDRIDENLGREICRQANVSALVIASIRKFGQLYTIDLKVLDTQENEYLFTAREEGQGQESVPSLIDKLSEKTRIGLKEKAEEIASASEKVADVTTTDLEAYQHFFQGEQLINQLEFEEAEVELEKAIRLDPTFGLAYYRLAYAINWRRGDLRYAALQIRKAVDLIDRIPEKEEYLVRALNADIQQGFKAGIAILKDMEQIYPHDKEMLYNIGDWSYHTQDYATAATYLEKVLTVDPVFERALQHLTWTYRDMGNYDKALDIAKRFVSAAASAEAYNLLANAYAVLGQFETGLITLKQSRELSPKNYAITRSIADFYMRQGEYDKAVAELRILIEDHQPPEARRTGYEGLASIYPYSGKYREALRAADEAIELYWQARDTTGAATMHLVKGMLLAGGWKDVDNAWKEVEATLPYRSRVRSPNYSGLLSLLRVYHGDYASADSLARVARWWHHVVLSLSHSVKRECARAQSFADSVLLAPRDFAKVMVLYPLAKCQYDAGQLDAAAQSLRNLRSLYDGARVERGHYYPKMFYLFAKIYEKQADRKLAIENYEQFLDLWKEADEDLPELIDAKARMVKLKRITAK